MSEKTGRGPLVGDWVKSTKPMMCCYKLSTIKFSVFGLQSRIEEFIARVSYLKFYPCPSSPLLRSRSFIGLQFIGPLLKHLTNLHFLHFIASLPTISLPIFGFTFQFPPTTLEKRTIHAQLTNFNAQSLINQPISTHYPCSMEIISICDTYHTGILSLTLGLEKEMRQTITLVNRHQYLCGGARLYR